MGVFTNSLKTFKSNITGTEKEYKVNNAVWLYMESDYNLKQGEWVNDLEKNEVLTLAKFTTSILKANKIDVTLEEVLQNTDITILNEFVNAYGEIALNFKDEKEEDKEKNA